MASREFKAEDIVLVSDMQNIARGEMLLNANECFGLRHRFLCPEHSIGELKWLEISPSKINNVFRFDSAGNIREHHSHALHGIIMIILKQWTSNTWSRPTVLSVHYYYSNLSVCVCIIIRTGSNHRRPLTMLIQVLSETNIFGSYYSLHKNEFVVCFMRKLLNMLNDLCDDIEVSGLL